MIPCYIPWDKMLLRISKAGVTNYRWEVDNVNDQNGSKSNWSELETMCPSERFWVLTAGSYFECFKSNSAEQLELSYIARGIQNGLATLEPVWQVLIKLNIYKPYEPAILPLDIYSREMKTYEKMCAQMFVAPLPVIAPNWKQPTCS